MLMLGNHFRIVETVLVTYIYEEALGLGSMAHRNVG